MDFFFLLLVSAEFFPLLMTDVSKTCFTLNDAFSFGNKWTINQAEIYPSTESQGKCLSAMLMHGFKGDRQMVRLDH